MSGFLIGLSLFAVFALAGICLMYGTPREPEPDEDRDVRGIGS